MDWTGVELVGLEFNANWSTKGNSEDEKRNDGMNKQTNNEFYFALE